MEMPSQEYFQAGCRESSAKLAPRLFVVSFGSQFTEFTPSAGQAKRNKKSDADLSGDWGAHGQWRVSCSPSHPI